MSQNCVVEMYALEESWRKRMSVLGRCCREVLGTSIVKKRSREMLEKIVVKK